RPAPNPPTDPDPSSPRQPHETDTAPADPGLLPGERDSVRPTLPPSDTPGGDAPTPQQPAVAQKQDRPIRSTARTNAHGPTRQQLPQRSLQLPTPPAPVRVRPDAHPRPDLAGQHRSPREAIPRGPPHIDKLQLVRG